MKSDVKDLSLSKQGRDRVEWAYRDMPVLETINASMSKSKNPTKTVVPRSVKLFLHRTNMFA